jgi:hypothetical protein
MIDKRSNTNSPANFIPGSPSTLYEDRSTPDSHSGRGGTSLGYHEQRGSPSLVSDGSQDYDMEAGHAQLAHQTRPLSTMTHFNPPISQSAQDMTSPPINRFAEENRPQTSVASGNLPQASSSGYHSRSSPPEIWQTPYSNLHHRSQERPSNPSGLSLPYTNPSPHQIGAPPFGFPPSQEPNQDEIWRNFIFEFGG